jgi:DNA helicase HerA-like ATPase
MKQTEFVAAVQKGYAVKGDSIQLGAAMLDGEVFPQAVVQLPLRTMNRHGLISGATGTGKTKTLAMIAEGLSELGVPVLMMDIKGDLSGLAVPGEPSPAIHQRYERLHLEWSPSPYPVEFLTLSHEPGVRLRATVLEFGPLLFAKILGLNETQSSVVSLVFKFCDEKRLPLLDLKDFKKVLEYITGPARPQVQQEYGLVPITSVSLIQRKLIDLEQQEAELFFGERSFEVEDLLRVDNGFGVLSILRLTDVQNRPKLFSSFMLQMLGELYATLPEAGDLEKPKLVLFIDEAHLIFEEAEKALLDQIETVIKLVRSKGVGIFFCTQVPGDIPSSVLGQLGMKIQHALRAFTPNDRKQIKLIAANYPESSFYDTETMLTSLGIGEALVTVLDERGIPTPLAATLLASPRSRMGPLTDGEIEQVLSRSSLAPKYNEPVDPVSAYEILGGKLEAAAQQSGSQPGGGAAGSTRRTYQPGTSPAAPNRPMPRTEPESNAPVQPPYPEPPRPSQPSVFDGMMKGVGGQVARQMGRTMAATITGAITRQLLGVMGWGGRTRRR